MTVISQNFVKYSCVTQQYAF